MVRESLRLHGSQGMEVTDVASLPSITSGNTNTPCMMIGTMAAHRIRAS